MRRRFAATAIALALATVAAFAVTGDDEPFRLPTCRTELTDHRGRILDYHTKQALKATYRSYGIDPVWLDGDYHVAHDRIIWTGAARAVEVFVIEYLPGGGVEWIPLQSRAVMLAALPRGLADLVFLAAGQRPICIIERFAP
ncbi:MAG: hypothetical protein F4Y94_10385 [Chloroflexi bacterium]|nr:hypothetical protein [Chloroflexota bacterium]